MLSFCAVVFRNKILCKAKIDNGEDECKSDQQKIRVQEICLYGHVSHFGTSLTLGLFQAGPDRASAATPESTRFLQLYKQLKDPASGYFSKEGIPYHSVETLMSEAPDYGHLTTSEAYSY